jgi:hypothetical protein
MRDVEQPLPAPRPNADSGHYPHAPELGRRLGVTVLTTPTCFQSQSFEALNLQGLYAVLDAEISSQRCEGQGTYKPVLEPCS